MLVNKIVVLFIMYCSMSFSQNKPYDITIVINEDVRKVEVENDTLIHQEFFLKDSHNAIQKSLSFNKSGSLIKTITVPRINGNSNMVFVYESMNKGNKPIVVRKKDIHNLLIYPDDFINKKDIKKLLHQANHIFISEGDKDLIFYTLKKVFLKKE